MHVLTNAEKLIPLRDAASLAESRRLAGMRMVTGTTSPSTRYERISVSPASCSIKSEYVIASHAFKPQYKCINYTPAWEQRKLGEFGSVAMCKRIYKEQTSEQGDVPFFKIGTFGADPDAFISNELFEDYKRTYPYPTPGTLLISAAGSIGRIVEYQGEKAYFQDSNIVWLEHEHRLNDAFLKPLYSKIEWGLEGSTIKRLYNKDLLSAEVTIPDGREQKEIGQFFAKLDDLITLHQRKYDKLVVFKKSMLEKMFPKDGESVPEIRFAGFTDPWEQRKASEVFQIVDDRGHPTLPVLSATQNQGMIYRDDSGRYIGHDESNEIGYKRVLPGDFVVHLRSFQGGFAHSQYEGITSPAYTVFRAKEPTSHSDRFWKHWFISEHFIAGLSTVTYGIRDGRSISVDEFMNTFLAFPAVEEQAAISRLLDYLDDLITLHQRKLELLRNIKKSLLDKMFV